MEEEEVHEPEENDSDVDMNEEASDNEGDHYYQFGDEEPEMRRPGAKRAGEDLGKAPEVKKEEPLPEFPEFPEKKPEPVIEPSMPTPLITVVDLKDIASDDDSDIENPSDEEKKDEDNDGEV